MPKIRPEFTTPEGEYCINGKKWCCRLEATPQRDTFPVEIDFGCRIFNTWIFAKHTGKRKVAGRAKPVKPITCLMAELPECS